MKLAKDLFVIKVEKYKKYTGIRSVLISGKRFNEFVIAKLVIAGHEESNIEGLG